MEFNHVCCLTHTHTHTHTLPLSLETTISFHFNLPLCQICPSLQLSDFLDVSTMTQENIITLLAQTDVGSVSRVSCHISALVSTRRFPSCHEEKAFAAELCCFPSVGE